MIGWAVRKFARLWRSAFYPWDTEPKPESDQEVYRGDLATNSEAPRQRSDWTLDFALDELQRCYDALRAGTDGTDTALATGDVRMAVPLAGCVADSVHATVLQLRVKIRKLERTLLKES